jgi:hypothetical protein
MPLPTASTLATGNHTVITSCDSCQNMRRRTRYRLKGDRWHHFVGACDGTSPEVRCECISSIYRDHQWLKKSQWGRRTAAPRLDVFFRQTVRAVTHRRNSPPLVIRRRPSFLQARRRTQFLHPRGSCEGQKPAAVEPDPEAHFARGRAGNH